MDIRNLHRLPVASALMALPLAAEAAQPSLFYQAYDAGLAPMVTSGLVLMTAARAFGGMALGRILTQNLTRNGYDVERFEQNRPRSRNALPVIAGVALTSLMAMHVFVGANNFEMAGFAALAGAGIMAGESLLFLGRQAYAYRASQLKLTTELERTEALTKYQTRTRERIAVLDAELGQLKAPPSESLIEKIKSEKTLAKSRESLEAERDYLQIRLDGLQNERYSYVFASHRGDLERYFENLSRVESKSEGRDTQASSSKRAQETNEVAS